MFKWVETYSDFMLKETLKTIDIDKTIYSIEKELSISKVNFKIKKLGEIIEFSYFPENINEEIYKSELDYILNLFIDRFGWFPSFMKLTNKFDMINNFKYDKDYLFNKFNFLKEINLTFEAKYNIESNITNKLYHLTIQEYENDINKKGLCPKSKSKRTNHLDRIYVCKDVEKCYNLIKGMKYNYIYDTNFNKENKINYKWIIYEIKSKDLDIKMFKDPNYKGGYYIIDNINPKLLKIYDREK